jgi:hypothetical protein
MSLNHRQQHQLYRIESRLRRSEPHLAAMLIVFDRLAAGQCLPAWEQVPSRRDRIGQATAQAFAVLVATAIVLTRTVLNLITATCSDRRFRPPTPKPERAARDLETGDSQDPGLQEPDVVLDHRVQRVAHDPVASPHPGRHQHLPQAPSATLLAICHLQVTGPDQPRQKYQADRPT